MARVSAVRYQETLWSKLYPGNATTMTCFQEAVKGTQSALELDAEQRQRTVWRMDSGAGSDANFRWLLQQGYHVHAKGFSNRRAGALAKQATRWDAYQDSWLAEVKSTFDFARPVRVFVQKRLKKGQYVHSYLVTTLTLPSKSHFMTYYYERGGAEVEQFRADKSGLALAVRRKRSFEGQSAYILLTDLVHNLLADFKRHGLADSKLAAFGLKRIVRDLLNMPGRLLFDGQKLTRIELRSQNQYSAELLICLEKYISGDFSD